MDVLIFFWLALAVIVGVAANTRGRSSALWVLLAIVISPLIAGLLLLALPGLDKGGAIFLENQKRKVSFLRSVLIATAIVLVVLFMLELLAPDHAPFKIRVD